MENRSNSGTLEYIMSQIEKIQSETQYLKEAFRLLENFEASTGPNGGLGDGERAQAIGNICVEREKTNQKMLDLLNKMYDGLNPPARNDPTSPDRLNGIRGLLESMDIELFTEYPENFQYFVDKLFQG